MPCVGTMLLVRMIMLIFVRLNEMFRVTLAMLLNRTLVWIKRWGLFEAYVDKCVWLPREGDALC